MRATPDLRGDTVSTHGYLPVVSHPAAPEPGQRCPTCDERKPKPRKSTSPTTKRSIAVGPPDRVDSLNELLENLQVVVGADPASYPRLTLLEAMAVVAGLHHREELIEAFADLGGKA